MKYSLAQLLAEQLPHLAGAPGGSPVAAPPQTAALVPYALLCDALRTGADAALLAALRDAGAVRAAEGLDVPGLIGAAQRFLDGVRRAVLADLPPGAPETSAVARELDALQTVVTAGLVSGYFAGQVRRADEQRLALEELAALFKINSAANSTLDFDQMLDRVVDHVMAAMRADVASLFIYEPEIDRLVLRATRGLTPDAVGRVRLRLGEGVTGWAGRAGTPLALSDGWQDSRFLHLPELGEEKTRAIVAVPIVLFTKLKLVGVITLQSYGDRRFTERDISFLETVAGELAIAIENARLHRDTDERLRQKVNELTILQGVSANIAATLQLQEVADMLASEAVRLMGADAAVLYELRAGRLMPVASFGLAMPAAAPGGEEAPGTADDRGADRAEPRPRPIDPQTSLVGRAILAGKPVAVEGSRVEPSEVLPAIGLDASLSLPGVGMDVTTPLRVAGDRDGLPFAMQLCVPLLAPRSIVGGLCIYSREARLFGDEQISLLLAFAREGAIAIENAHLYEEARRGLEMQTLLLREMHHRVRNNLQRTASLLRMQANRLPDDNAARQALQESVIRVHSIARVHDLLSRQQVGLTDVGAVAHLACEVVNNTLGRPDLHMRWQVETAPLILSSREAFPLTLLLTELLSNSMLHGFAGRDEGQVTIAASREPDQLRLVITDNGQGLPPEFALERDSHLGLEMIHRLGEQELGGRVTIGPNPHGPGTRTIFSFPYLGPPGPVPTEADRAREAAGLRVGV